MIELLVALSIIAILMLVAVPLFNTLITNYKISAQADALSYYLQLARSEAIKTNSNVYVSFQTGDTWCYGGNAGSACDCSVATNCSLGAVSYSAAQQISLTTTAAGNSFYFEGTHGAANASSTITFTKYGASSPLITVLVGRLGGIQMCSTGISWYTAC